MEPKPTTTTNTTTTTNSQVGKIINMFAVVGLNEDSLTKYNDSDNITDFIQNIDIIYRDVKEKEDVIIFEDNTKLLLLNKNDSFWLRIIKSVEYNSPITMIKIIPANYDKNKEFLIVERKYLDIGEYYPVDITYLKDNEGFMEHQKTVRIHKIINI